MAKPKRKGKSKQKSKPKIVVETTAELVQDVPEQEVETPVVEEVPMSEKDSKKLAKAQEKKDKKIAKEKADKKKKEAREKAGKVGVGRRLKETGSELKKISWPSFKQVVKKTGVVIAVVLFFAVVLFAFDRLLSWLYSLLV